MNRKTNALILTYFSVDKSEYFIGKVILIINRIYVKQKTKFNRHQCNHLIA